MGDNRNMSTDSRKSEIGMVDNRLIIGKVLLRHLPAFVLRTGEMMENNDFEKMNIQWFPGHMTKAQRMIEDNIKLVDAVCEVIDAHPARQPQPGYRPPCRGQAPPCYPQPRRPLQTLSLRSAGRRALSGRGWPCLRRTPEAGRASAASCRPCAASFADKLREYEAKGSPAARFAL